MMTRLVIIMLVQFGYVYFKRKIRSPITNMQQYMITLRPHIHLASVKVCRDHVAVGCWLSAAVDC